MKEPKFIITQFDRYTTCELWQTNSGYEIRTRNTQGSDPGYGSVKQISQEEALQFRIEAERQQAKWDLVDKEHQVVANFSVKNSYSELQRMPDGSHRVASFQSPLETADDFRIYQADEARIAQFLEEADHWNTRDWLERLESKGCIDEH